MLILALDVHRKWAQGVNVQCVLMMICHKCISHTQRIYCFCPFDVISYLPFVSCVSVGLGVCAHAFLHVASISSYKTVI